jgi:hypothetical protein
MIPKTHIKAFGRILQDLKVREDDLKVRMDAAFENNKDHLVYLAERAMELNRYDEKETDWDFHDLDRFLFIFGLHNIIEPDDHIEQPFLIAVFAQYQRFLNEARAIKKEMLEAKIEMYTLNIQYYTESLTERKHWADFDPFLYKDEALRKQGIELKAMYTKYVEDTTKEIEGFQKQIAMDKLYLKTFQKETLN